MAKSANARAPRFASGGAAVTTPTRRLDHEHVARYQLRTVGAGQVLASAVSTFHPLPAQCAILASLQAKRCHFASRCDDDGGHWFKKPDATNCSIAAAPASRAARSTANGKHLQPYRVAQLKHLRIGHPRIGHVRMNRRSAGETGAGAGAAADCLVVL